MPSSPRSFFVSSTASFSRNLALLRSTLSKTDCRRTDVFEAEDAFLAALAVLRIEPAEQLERFQRRIGGFALAVGLGQPHAVDHAADGDALRGIIQEDGGGAAGDRVAEDVLRRWQSRRLPRGEQPGAVDAVVAAAAGDELHRGAGRLRVPPLRGDLDSHHPQPIAPPANASGPA